MPKPTRRPPTPKPTPTRLTRSLAQFASCGGIGNLPAPGSMGSLLALVVGGGITIHFGIGVLVIAIIACAIIAFPAIDAYSRLTNTHDSKHIVIDEVLGQWLTMLAIPIPPTWQLEYGVSLVVAFLLFRLFDISKPWFIATAEDLPGAAGVIADDILAAVVAGAILMLAGHFALSYLV
ncbi:MAG: phosphatidylglycerophosphatase A [Proteobacteria bacterium]|nr:phosphatidylglycerophosphatase A [Pseudomonadota bacterium]